MLPGLRNGRVPHKSGRFEGSDSRGRTFNGRTGNPSQAPCSPKRVMLVPLACGIGRQQLCVISPS